MGLADVDQLKSEFYLILTQFPIIPAIQHSISQVPADCLKK
ncbi:hypothetical protein D1BOALGB6SA_9468 [Olavius sp. associated proteobacterium Delta 1]|nr:hypothetical protein D1BOALGB6SA_9468 [Olavius sp. associated proteobacterium Delta 1]